VVRLRPGGRAFGGRSARQASGQARCVTWGSLGCRARAGAGWLVRFQEGRGLMHPRNCSLRHAANRSPSSRVSNVIGIIRVCKPRRTEGRVGFLQDPKSSLRDS
jgi:hypothetical protein